MNVVCEFSVEKARVPGSLDWPSTSAEAAKLSGQSGGCSRDSTADASFACPWRNIARGNAARHRRRSTRGSNNRLENLKFQK
jgi:hypothetical protein